MRGELLRGDQATGRSTTVVTLATEGGSRPLGKGRTRTSWSRKADNGTSSAGGWRTDRLVADRQKQVNLADPDVAALVGHLLEAAQWPGQKID
jgi:hypothetical protein